MNKNIIANDFKKILKDLRTERGLSQDEFAKELEISKGAVSYYETGQRVPDIVVLSAFADYFGVSTDYLLGRTQIQSVNEDVQIACKVTGLSEKAVFVLSEVIPTLHIDIGDSGEPKTINVKDWLIIDVLSELSADVSQMLLYLLISALDDESKARISDYIYGAIAKSTDKCKYKIDKFIKIHAQKNGIDSYKSVLESGTDFHFDFYKDGKAGD